MAKKTRPMVVIFLLISALLIGALSMYLYLNWARPTGWILDAKGTDTSYLSLTEIRLLRDLIQNGSLFTQADILESFVAYYHTLISILITIILFLAGFLTYNFFRSRTEYNELMERELRNYLHNYERMVAESEKAKDELDKYEDLQSWLHQRVHKIVEGSDDAFLGMAAEAIFSELFSDSEFIKRVKSEVENGIAERENSGGED